MFKLTEEQSDVVSASVDTSDNLLIQAYAGAAKTSTLVLIAEALPKVQILCLAFNVRIAKEMRERLPSNCKAQTLNSLGHRAWSEAIGQNYMKVDDKKTYNNLKNLIDDLQDPAEVKEAYESFADIMKSIRFAKSCGYIPTDTFPKAKRLMDDDDFKAHMEEEPSELEWYLIRESMLMSIKQAFKGHIDYDDQILMPTVFNGLFPRFPLVMVDEAQDLSALNHVMIKKLVKKRLIAVGDECQAIYGFRGAHENSMGLLEKEFTMHSLPLTVSFRCPVKVVEEARWRAPQMQSPEWAKSGEVNDLQSWSVEHLPEEAAIICRNNAPLFSMAIKLLKNGRYPQLVGVDMGKSLIKLMKKLGPGSMSQAEARQKVLEWKEEKLKKSRNDSKVIDQAECMLVFLKQGETLSDAVAYANHLLQQHGPIQLMTGHKAKGLEFNNVFILDRFLLRLKPGSQDNNLLYVMQTRAQECLNYVRSEDFIDDAAEEDDDEE